MSARGLRGLIVAGVIAGTLAMAPSMNAQVRRNNRCAQHIRQAEANLQKAIRRHGEHSKQANQRRRQLEKVRERCGGRLDRGPQAAPEARGRRGPQGHSGGTRRDQT